jgi:hypothetical protein
MSRGAGLALGRAEADQRLAALRTVCVAGELDRVSEQLQRLGRSEALKRLLAGFEGVVGSLGLVHRDRGQAPVQGEL